MIAVLSHRSRSSCGVANPPARGCGCGRCETKRDIARESYQARRDGRLEHIRVDVDVPRRLAVLTCRRCATKKAAPISFSVLLELFQAFRRKHENCSAEEATRVEPGTQGRTDMTDP